MHIINNSNKRDKRNYDSVNEIITKYYEPILNYCRYNLISDVSVAEDCTQDVFVAYILTIEKTNITFPKAWLYRTADNYVNRYKRSIIQERHTIFSLPDDEKINEENKFAYEQDFDQFMEEGINFDNDAKKVLSQLSIDEFKLYESHFKEHCTLKELSVTYGITIPAIKSRLYRLKLHIIRVSTELINNERKFNGHYKQ